MATKTWAGNTYYNVNENTKPVYSGSSSGGHVVKTGTTTGSLSKSSGSKSSGKSGKVKTATTTQKATSIKAYSGYHGGGGGGGSSDDGYDAEKAREEYLKKLQKLAKKVYNANMAGINSSFTNAGNTLKTNYDSTTGQLEDKFNYQNKLVNTDAENSMRQAYINSMLQKKDLAQRMSALGLSGGATETTMAGLNNNYSNARNNIDTTRQRSLSDLNQTYQGNLAEAMRQYNTAASNLAMQRAEAEQAARNAYLQLAVNYQFNPGSISMPTTDYNTALTSQSNYTYTPTAANNNVVGVSSVQGDPSAINPSQNNYAMYLASQRASGATDGDIKNSAYSALQSGKINGNELVSILDQLGVQV